MILEQTDKHNINNIDSGRERQGGKKNDKSRKGCKINECRLPIQTTRGGWEGKRGRGRV